MGYDILVGPSYHLLLVEPSWPCLASRDWPQGIGLNEQISGVNEQISGRVNATKGYGPKVWERRMRHHMIKHSLDKTLSRTAPHAKGWKIVVISLSS